MLLRQLTARMAAPGAAKAAAGIAPLLCPLAVRGASSAAGPWAPAAPKQQTAARGQQQQVQSYTYEPVGMDAAAEIGEVDFDPAAANSGACPRRLQTHALVARLHNRASVQLWAGLLPCICNCLLLHHTDALLHSNCVMPAPARRAAAGCMPT